MAVAVGTEGHATAPMVVIVVEGLLAVVVEE